MHLFPGPLSQLGYAWRQLRGVAAARRSRGAAAAFVCACVCVRATHSRGRKEDFIIIILYKKCAVLRAVQRVAMCVVCCVANGRCALYLSALRCAVGRVVARAVQRVAERVAIWAARKCLGGGRAADTQRENGGGGSARKWRRRSARKWLAASGLRRSGGRHRRENGAAAVWRLWGRRKAAAARWLAVAACAGGFGAEPRPVA